MKRVFDHYLSAKEICDKQGFSNPTYVADGSFKYTYRASSGNREVAVKVLDPAKTNVARFERETAAVKSLDSDVILTPLKDGFFDRSDGLRFAYIIEDFLPNGTLSDKIRDTNTLHKSDVILLGRQVVSLFKHLKEKSLAHRDIKPDNILYDGANNPKVVDFGIVRMINEASITSTWQASGPCTPLYASPEQLNNDKKLIDWKTDQYSTGVVLIEAITGCHPSTYPNPISDFDSDRVASRSEHDPSLKVYLNSIGLGIIHKMVAPWPIERHLCPFKLEQLFGKL